MKPSDIVLADPVPLTATFEHVEAEQMAAMLILVLQKSGDEWRPVLHAEVGDLIQGWMDAPKDAPFWANNPFFNPDIDDLIKRGFAEWIGDPSEGRKRPMQFTSKGMQALRDSRWVKKEEPRGD